MATDSPFYTLRAMKIADVEQVSQIDRLSFSMPWSPLTIAYEVQQNPDSYMGVIALEGQFPPPNSQNLGRLQVILRPFKKNPSYTITAFGGLWVRGREAHISTIATHPDFRGCSLGELMLVGLIYCSIHAKANFVALEVRVSNTIAQNLYRKYGFVETKLLHQYYHDNREDAYLMVVNLLDESYKRQLQQHLKNLFQKVLFEDTFTGLTIEQYAGS